MLHVPIFSSKPPDPSPADCRPPSIYLLPPEPVQQSHKPITQGNSASAHIFTEFGLQVTELCVYVCVHVRMCVYACVSIFDTLPQILLTSLKRGKVNRKSNEHLQMMDPFVELLTNLLISRHPTVSKPHTTLFTPCFNFWIWKSQILCKMHIDSYK